ncbi:MAG: hypothetical protein ACFFAE_19590, partial [Candidatus Hodarchaeota archaeon]
MIKPKNVVIASVIIIICGGAFLMLLTSSSVPIFTVKELMDNLLSDSFLNRKIQVIGVVKGGINITGFYINDPDDVTNLSLEIYINATNVEIPAGVESGKTILVEGKLISISKPWILKATMIS